MALGFSTGWYCVFGCLPIFLPLVVDDEARRPWRQLAAFMAGRLVAYLLVGGLSGLIGAELAGKGLALKVFPMVFIVVGSWLIVAALGRLNNKACSCSQRLSSVSLTMVIGFTTSISVCPPLVAAVVQVVALGNVVSGLVFFALFFLATSTFMIPLVLLPGMLRYKQNMRTIARLVMLLMGACYCCLGVLAAVGN